MQLDCFSSFSLVKCFFLIIFAEKYYNDRILNMANLYIKTIWSDKASIKEIEDFCFVVNTVFDSFCTSEYFNRKYIDNIYGPSALFIAYVDDKAVGACSLWRNDLEGQEAYLAAEASVLTDYRGIGIYSAMLRARTDFATKRNTPLIYTFPNENSFPRLLKKNWQARLLRKVFFYPGLCSDENVSFIEPKYALWWLRRSKDIFHILRFGQYYLVKTVRVKGVARILGRIDKVTALQFPVPDCCLWIFYRESEKTTFYNRRWAYTPIAYINGDGSHIPFWKMDSL